MNTAVVWVMVIVGTHNSNYNVGPEFTTKQKCEVAAQVVYNAGGMVHKAPVCVCVRIEK